MSALTHVSTKNGLTTYDFKEIQEPRVCLRIADECQALKKSEQRKAIISAVASIGLTVLLGLSLLNALALTAIIVYFISSDSLKKANHYQEQAHFAKLREAELNPKGELFYLV